MTTTLRIASLTCALTCLALTACQINDTGGVYACTDDGDCAGHGGGSRCLPTGYCGIPADAGPSCGVGLSVCDGQCVLLSSDPHHCGACGTACGNGQACISGACADDATPTITAHLDSPALTKDGFASFHVTSCSGIASVFVSSSTSTPASDAAFTQCTTSGLSSALTEGANTIAIWAKSAGGTVSTSPATLAVTKDSTAPVLTLTGLADGATVGSDQFLPVTLTIADASPIASARVELSADQGSTWIAGLIAGATTSTSIAGTVYLPASSTTWQVRLVGTDVLGNTSTQARGTLVALVCDPSGAPFGGGLGGPAHPYRICSNAQLLAAQGHATDDFRLEADLELAGAALRLGNRNDSTFDGNGHAIAHYTISTPAGAASYVTGVGLFDLLTNATIKNLSVVVDSISGHDARGVGGVVGDTDQSSVIEDVDVTIGTTISGVAGVGGAIGRLKGLANRVRVHGSGSTGSNVICESADGALDPFKGVIGGVIGEHEGTAIALSANALNVTCDAPASDSGSTGGLIGFLAGGASASDLSGTNLTVSAAQFAGGLIGESDDAVNNAMLQASFVNCLGDTPASGANAGGLIGFLSGALTNGTVSGVRVNCGNPNGNGVGGLVGNSAPGASVVNGSVQGGAVIGHINVGGALGYSSGSVTNARTTGLTVVSGLTAIGGVIGHADTTASPLTQLGSDAYLFESDFVDVNLGGLIGLLSVAGTSSIAISQCASHAHFGSPGATGSLLGSIAFNTSGPVQGTVSFTDCYGDTAPAILAANVSSGGLIGYVAPSGTLRLTRVFEFARAPDNACIAGLEQNPPPPFTYTNVSWNTDRCAQSSAPAGATGVAESAFAQTSTFTGYDFTGTWAMGGNHPKLRWEPPELAGSGGVQPNGAVGFFDAHPTIGADLIIPISITATGFGGVDLAQVEYSSDGVRWFIGSSIGPYAGGTQTNVSFYAPAVIGEYTVRLRVVAHDGTTMVKPAGTFLAVECSPTARPFGGGRGNDDKPYRICDPNQLMAVTSTINSSFRMYSDVDVTGFTPVLGGKFRGYFDGAGFTIKHFSAVRAASSTAPLRFGWGLFNGVGGINGQNQVGNGSVTNLTIQVDAIDGQDTNSVGALVGNVNQGGSVTHSHVIMTGHLTGSGATGGAIGFVNQQAGLVTDITVDGGGTVACSTSTKTGPIGYAFGGVIGNSSGASSGLHASGITVTCAYPQTSAVGGVVGAASGAAFDDFSASGVTIQAYNQLGGAAGSLGEGTFTRVTSTGATVTCLGSGDDNNPDFANAGGAVGNVWSQATTTTVDRVSSFGSSVSCPNSRFIGVTVGNMGSGSNGAVGVSISHGLTSGGRADGQSEVGGFIGGMGNGGALATTQVVGSPSVRGTNSAGGVAGGLYGGTITQVSTDAFVQGETSQVNHGGVVGGMNAYLNQTTRVSQAISRATFANNGNGSNTYGGLIGGLGTWRDENGVPYPNQHVYVSDSYAETDSPDSGLFGFIDNEGDAHVDRVFAFANAGSGFCIVPPPCCSTTTTGLSTSGIFYNRDVCREVDTSGATTQPPGTGLAQSSFASSASFPGYDFSTNGLWKQGPRHPQLRWELESAPSLTLTDVPAQLAFDRSANLTLTVNASLQAALIQVSYDGIHWFTITTLGPMSPGTTFFSLENLGVIGTAYLRAVAIEPDGTEAVYDLGRTQYVECDPTIGPFGGGKGTASDPLRICSVTQLQAVNNYQGLLAQSYKLTQDLDLTGSGTQPLFIQVPGSRFDGGGHLIDNFQYTQADTSNTEYDKGLFGYIGDYNATTGTAPVTVAHLRVGVSGVSAPNSMNVGGFAGHLGRDAVIDDVHVLLHGDIGGLAQIGGLAGFNDTGAQVTNSSVASATPGAGSVTCLNPAQGGATGGAFGYFGGDATGIDVRDVAISCVVQDLRFSGNAGGIAGSVSGSLTNVSAHQVRVTSPIYAGGISGNLSGPVQSALVEDSLVQGSTTSTEQGDQIGGAVGATFTGASVDGLTVSGVTVTSQYNVGGAIGLAYQGGPVVLANARILDTHVIGVGPAGGAIGNLSSGDVHDVFVDANSTVTADNNCAGGLSGAVDPNLSWTLTRISVAAHLDSGPSGTSGGIFCAWYPNDGVFASADAIASHVVFEGNLNYVAGFIGNLNANGVTGLSVTDVDIQSTLAGSSGPAMTGGVFGSVTGSNFTAQLTHTVVDAALPSGACFAGFNSALITASESYWNSTRCGGSPGMGTGVTDASFAKTASFPGLDFGSTWSIRDGHPGLRFEQ